MEKLFLLVICELIIFSGCWVMPPNKNIGIYLKSLTYKPDNYYSIVGKYSTEPNFTTTEIDLFKDSTFHYKSWGDIIDADDKGIYGKYFISGDTLLLISDHTIYKDSLLNNSGKSITEILSNIQRTYFRYPFLFKKFENDIYIISTTDMPGYLKELFLGNVDDRIKREPKKIE